MGTTGQRLAVWAAVLVVVWAAYVVVRPLLAVLLLAGAIASLTVRPFRWTERRLRGRTRLAAALTLGAVVACVVVPLATIAALVAERLVVEITQLARDLASGPGRLAALTDRLGPAGPAARAAVDRLGTELGEAAPALARRTATLAATIGSTLAKLGAGTFLLLIAFYYFLVDGTRWRLRLKRLVPLPEEDFDLFMTRFHEVAVGVLLGNLGTAIAQGALATVGYFLFGAPLPLLWGTATVIAALIPVVGTVLVWAPLSVVVWLQHGWLHGLLLALWGALVVGTIDNLVRPLLTKRGLQIHPLAIFVAVFGGLITWGFAGILLGPLVIAVAVTVLEVYERRRPPTVYPPSDDHLVPIT